MAGGGGGGPPPPPPPASSHSSAGQPLVITENWREVVLVPSLPASIYFTSSLAGHTATPSSDLAWLTLDLEVSPSLTLLTPHLPPSHHSLLSWLSILSQVWPPPTYYYSHLCFRSSLRLMPSWSPLKHWWDSDSDSESIHFIFKSVSNVNWEICSGLTPPQLSSIGSFISPGGTVPTSSLKLTWQ